nr:glycoside hydrolase family 32 protein [Paenibacillus oenotherae]
MTTTSYKEAYRPQFHYSPPAQWMNDPNGMVYFEGEYHLFYQYHPESTIWGPMHWGHAVSTDLVHWEQLPVALKPDHNGYIFSGSAVVDWNDTSGFFGGSPGLVAVFTHAKPQPGSEESLQSQSLAYSSDKGRTWTMFAGNPVITDERFADFRDPKVFWDKERSRWAMVLAAGDRILFYSSPDLKDWSYCSEFGLNEGAHMGVWECPDLFELPVEGGEGGGIRKWVLVVSIGADPDFPEGSRTQYFIGSYDGTVFVSDNPAETILWLDHGRDNYAGVSWSDIPAMDGRRLLIGWMSNWKYANQTPTDAWRGAMTIPRVLTLRSEAEGIRLIQAPIQEIRTLREPLVEMSDLLLSPGHNPLAHIHEGCLEIEVEFELLAATECGFSLKSGGEKRTVVAYHSGTETLYIDRSLSGITDFHETFACRHDARLIPKQGCVRMHLFIDHSSVEVFAGDGSVVMTDLLFPEPGSSGIELFAAGANVRIRTLRVFRLQSVWG